MALEGWAIAEAMAGRPSRARPRGHEALEAIERGGDRAGSGFSTYNLGVVEVLLGDLQTARALLQRPVVNEVMPGRHRAVGWHRVLLAQVCRRLGDECAARRAGAEAREIFSRLGERAGLAAIGELGLTDAEPMQSQCEDAVPTVSDKPRASPARLPAERGGHHVNHRF
jgi:hypothetical protein